MSHEGQFARNISFNPGETQSDQPVTRTRGIGDPPIVGTSASPASHGANGQRNTSQANSDTLNANTLIIVKSLDNVLDDFRNKKISKPRAIALFTSKLEFDTSRDEPAKEAALLECLNAVESIERLTVEAAQRGKHAEKGLTEPEDAIPLNIESGEKTRATHNKETETFLRSFILDQSRKRGREPSVSEDEEDIVGEDGGSEGLSNKKQRVFERDMPWYRRESTARESANPSCTKTREILTTFARDYTTVKHWITVSLSAPCGFPSTEWENIIKGKPVNLDSVLSSLHHISPVKENVGRVGSTEISLGRSEPTRRVKTNGEWTSAWNATIKATSFAFPHREDELREYGDYMDREFSSKVVSAHRKLILYDEAVRGEVAGGQKILLTERNHFSYIYSAIVLPDGIESEVRKSTTNSSGTKSQPDICRRFNSAAQCPNDSATCRYRHICSNCKRTGHSKPNCDTGEGKTSKKPSS
jgi:hypothetical protein